MASDNLMSLILGALDRSEKVSNVLLEDVLARRRAKEMKDYEFDQYKEKLPLEEASDIRREHAKPRPVYQMFSPTGQELTAPTSVKPILGRIEKTPEEKAQEAGLVRESQLKAEQKFPKPYADFKNKESFKRSLKFIIGRLETDQEIKEFKKQNISLNQVDNILTAVRNGNTVAASGLGIKMARGMGEVGVLTEADVTRYVESGQMTRKAGDRLLRWVSGVPSEATLDEIQEISNVLKSQFDGKVKPLYDKYAQQLSNLEDISVEEAYTYLAIPENISGKKEVPKTPIPSIPGLPVKTGEKDQILNQKKLELKKKLGL